MTYGLALGRYGTLNLVFLSDTANRFVQTGQRPVRSALQVRPLMLESPQQAYEGGILMTRASARASLPIGPAVVSPQLYLDPG